MQNHFPPTDFMLYPTSTRLCIHVYSCNSHLHKARWDRSTACRDSVQGRCQGPCGSVPQKKPCLLSWESDLAIFSLHNQWASFEGLDLKIQWLHWKIFFDTFYISLSLLFLLNRGCSVKQLGIIGIIKYKRDVNFCKKMTKYLKCPSVKLI